MTRKNDGSMLCIYLSLPHAPTPTSVAVFLDRWRAMTNLQLPGWEAHPRGGNDDSCTWLRTIAVTAAEATFSSEVATPGIALNNTGKTSIRGA